MGDPIVGSGEEHGNNVREGMARAASVRDDWLRSLRLGEVKFAHAVEASKSEEHKALSRVRLLDILSGRPGWNDLTAREAMLHQGFGVKDTIQSIRRSPTKINKFAILMVADSDRWRPRPSMPAGWPFFGKLNDVLAQTDSPLRIDEDRKPESGDIAPAADEYVAEESRPQIEDALSDLLEGRGA